MAGQGMQQTQNLALHQILSPQLQQSLLILQTPLLELRNLVQQEMETNPVLEELPDQPATDERSEAEPSADENLTTSSKSSRVWMRNGAITWRNRLATAPMAGAVREKHKISANSFSIPFPSRKRFSKIWSGN